MNVHLYVSNHQSILGIEDYIFSLKKIFDTKQNSFSLVDKVTKETDILILIEEFTNDAQKTIEVLREAKSLSIKTCLVHTEFPSKDLFFNIFSKKDLLFRKSILADTLLNINTKRKKYKFFYLPFSLLVFIYACISFLIFFEIKNLHSRLYFSIRDKALKKFINMFDYHLSLSEDLSKCVTKHFKKINILTLYPLIENEFLEKISETNNNMVLNFLSGNLTNYREKTLRDVQSPKNNFLFREKRQNLLKKIFDFSFFKEELKRLKSLDQNLIFTDFIYLNENNILDIEKYFKSNINQKLLITELYISQRENWPFLSPMRIVRSLRKGFIPVNIGNYKPILLDKLCINSKNLHEFKKNNTKLILEYKSNIKLFLNEYNKKSYSKNTKVINKILS
tara:strand:- start:2971 stop:4149 length:1179 start_codon:yes stop_codon:yes gene_type:complete